MSAGVGGERVSEQALMSTPRPDWANQGVDKRAALHWDTSQTVANCTVGGKHALAVIDTGSYKTILDVGMARILGLPVREAVNGDCGTYSAPSPGQSTSHNHH